MTAPDDAGGRPLEPRRERAVSPVVGAALMLVVVVLLVAILTGLLFGLSDEPGERPRYASFETEYTRTGVGNTDNRPYVVITHRGGSRMDASRLFVVDSDGNRVRWSNVWTGGPEVEPLEYLHVDGYNSDGALNHACKGEVYRLVYEPADGGSQVITEIEITRKAVGDAADHC